jgi:hypothetical protein
MPVKTKSRRRKTDQQGPGSRVQRAVTRPATVRPLLGGPKLFGFHKPSLHTDTRTDWEGRSGGVYWLGSVADEGATWCFIWQAQRVGGGYSTRAAAKRAIERYLERALGLLEAIVMPPGTDLVEIATRGRRT